MKNITFDKSAKEFVLEAFGKTVNSDGVIVERDNLEQEVLSLDGEHLRIESFAGLKKGSEIFFKSDIVSLIDILDKIGNNTQNLPDRG